MAFLVTNNHDTIRAWIEKNGGVPAVPSGATDTLNSLSIQFASNPGMEPITWEEFFDVFETSLLSFRYNPDIKKGEENMSFNFISRDTVPSLSNNDLLMPEDNEMLEDNMFPSSSNDHGQEGESTQ